MTRPRWLRSGTRPPRALCAASPALAPAGSDLVPPAGGPRAAHVPAGLGLASGQEGGREAEGQALWVLREASAGHLPGLDQVALGRGRGGRGHGQWNPCKCAWAVCGCECTRGCAHVSVYTRACMCKRVHVWERLLAFLNSEAYRTSAHSPRGAGREADAAEWGVGGRPRERPSVSWPGLAADGAGRHGGVGSRGEVGRDRPAEARPGGAVWGPGAGGKSSPERRQSVVAVGPPRPPPPGEAVRGRAWVSFLTRPEPAALPPGPPGPHLPRRRWRAPGRGDPCLDAAVHFQVRASPWGRGGSRWNPPGARRTPRKTLASGRHHPG